MIDPRNEVFSGSDCQHFGTDYNRIVRALPADLSRTLRSVFKAYWTAYGIEGVYERFHGRSVARVLEEYQQPELPGCLASGERDGVRYTLYDAPTGGEGSV